MQLTSLGTKICAFLVTAFLFPLNASSQWLNGQAADLVFGQPNFTTATSGLSLNKLTLPYAVVVEPSTKKVFVADYNGRRILRYANYETYSNGAPAEMALTKINTNIDLDGPTGIAIENNTLWLCEPMSNRILRIPNATTMGDGALATLVLGQTDFTSTTAGSGMNQLDAPLGLFFKDNTLWVSHAYGKVYRYDQVNTKTNGAAADAYLGDLSGLTTAKTMIYPSQLYVDAQNNLWVADRENHRVLKFNNAKTFSNQVSASVVLGHLDFTTGTRPISSSPNTLTEPEGVYGDALGNLYVGEAGSGRILVYKNAASLSNGAAADVVIGQLDFTSSSLAVGDSRLNAPLHLFVDNYLWVADSNNHRVLRFSPLYTLPVSLLSYTLKSEADGQILVNWSTANEANNKHFELLLSTDGKEFKAATLVNSKATGGNSQTQLDYTVSLNADDLLARGAMAGFGLLGLLLMPALRNKATKLLMLALVVFAFAACEKEYSNKENTQVYVKLIQVDRDGTTQELGIHAVKVRLNK